MEVFKDNQGKTWEIQWTMREATRYRARTGFDCASDIPTFTDYYQMLYLGCVRGDDKTTEDEFYELIDGKEGDATAAMFRAFQSFFLEFAEQFARREPDVITDKMLTEARRAAGVSTSNGSTRSSAGRSVGIPGESIPSAS